MKKKEKEDTEKLKKRKTWGKKEREATQKKEKEERDIEGGNVEGVKQRKIIK